MLNYYQVILKSLLGRRNWRGFQQWLQIRGFSPDPDSNSFPELGRNRVRSEHSKVFFKYFLIIIFDQSIITYFDFFTKRIIRIQFCFEGSIRSQFCFESSIRIRFCFEGSIYFCFEVRIWIRFNSIRICSPTFRRKQISSATWRLITQGGNWSYPWYLYQMATQAYVRT